MGRTMTFQSLKIEAITWGQNKGKLVAEISIAGENSKTTLILPDRVAEEILKLAKSALIDGVEKAANDFILEITTTIPDKLQLTEAGR